jgi:hypothetical protein
VHQFLPPRADLEILDSGSGTGFYLDRWQELGFPNVHASDVSEVAVQRLRERYPSCEVTQLDIAGLREPCQPGEAGRAVGLLRELRAAPQSEKAQQVNRSPAEIEFLLRTVRFEPLRRRPMFVLMNYPHSTTRVHRLCWRALVLAMVAWNPLGAVLVAVLYPLEQAPVARLKEGPSTELMLCRRLPDH